MLCEIELGQMGKILVSKKKAAGLYNIYKQNLIPVKTIKSCKCRTVKNVIFILLYAKYSHMVHTWSVTCFILDNTYFSFGKMRFRQAMPSYISSNTFIAGHCSQNDVYKVHSYAMS